MKRFFIVEIYEDGFSSGISTDNLHRDFIQRNKISWEEDSGGSPFSAPEIKSIEVEGNSKMIYIFDMSTGSASPGMDVRSTIAEFNLFTEDFYDDLIDFIQQYWRIIESGIDESNSVKKFKDFI
jgi:hypothetical protein